MFNVISSNTVKASALMQHYWLLYKDTVAEVTPNDLNLLFQGKKIWNFNITETEHVKWLISTWRFSNILILRSDNDHEAVHTDLPSLLRCPPSLSSCFVWKRRASRTRLRVCGTMNNSGTNKIVKLIINPKTISDRRPGWGRNNLNFTKTINVNLSGDFPSTLIWRHNDPNQTTTAPEHERQLAAP